MLKVDRLANLVRDLASVSGVALRGPLRDRVVFGRFEAQVVSRRTVVVEALNAHGVWETLIQGSEENVYVALSAAKRLFDIGLQGRFTK